VTFSEIFSHLVVITDRITGIDAGPPFAIGGSSTGPEAFGSVLDSAVRGTGVRREPERYAAAAAVPIEHLIRASAAAWGVDPALVKAIIANESGFDANATSPTGAQGLMQLEPGTAAELGVGNAYDPAQNIWGGTRYIRGLLQRFHGDVRLAVAAYNAGPGAVEKYGGVPPYAQTQAYVQNVLNAFESYKAR
jgi:soluble lytic murein transglycosylase-like protein